jgi:hypothetical protein
VSIIIKTYITKETTFLKRSNYINLNKVLVKLDFRKLDFKIDDQITDIMSMLLVNCTEYNDVAHNYYATLIVRKLILLYEMPANSRPFEDLLEVNIFFRFDV